MALVVWVVVAFASILLFGIGYLCGRDSERQRWEDSAGGF